MSSKDRMITASDNLEEKAQNCDIVLSATEDMCKYCFDLIINELTQHNNNNKNNKNNNNKHLDGFIKSIIPTKSQCPLFVTWDTHKEGDYHLRGCIGTLAPCELRGALGEYAKTSAFRDPRFRPIALHEVPNLRVSVSLLVNYEDCEHCLDWEIGVHGIIINFVHQSKNFSATYLPEVAAEQKWTQQEAIKSLVHKAGFRHKLTHDIQSKIRCTKYQSSKHYLKYDQYAKMTGSGSSSSI
jgi:uncharacterized protein (TIGR00296 family)